MRRSTLAGAVLLIAAATGSGAPAGAAGDAAAGRDLARAWCASCHVVDRTGGGTDAVPGFAAIAADPGLTTESLRRYLANPRHPMPNPQLSTAQIDDLVAYILGLRQQ